MPPCHLCGEEYHATYDFLGITMLDCPLIEQGEDRHVLAFELDPDAVTGLTGLWTWVPYDPVTYELLDWLLPASLVHDSLYTTQLTSRKEADEEWYEIARIAIGSIRNRELRDIWHVRAETKYHIIRKSGWIPWYKRKLLKFFSK